MKKIFWSFLHTFFESAFPVLFILLLGNLLLPKELGIYVILLLVVTYFASFLGFDLESTIIQKLNDQKLKGKENAYYTAGFISLILLSLFACGLAFFFHDLILSIFKLSQESSLFFFAIPLIFLRMQRRYLGNVLVSHLELKKQTIIDSIAAFLQIIFLFVFLHLGLHLVGIFLAVYIAEIISFLGKYFLTRKFYQFQFTNDFFRIVKDLFSFSFLLYFGSIAILLDSTVDLFFVNYFLTKSEVAMYNYAIKIAFALLLIGYSVSKLTFPLMTRAFSAQLKEKIKSLYSKSLNLSFVLATFCALLLIFNIEFILGLVLPNSYLAMVEILILLVAGYVLFTFFTSVGTMFTALGKPLYGSWLLWFSLSVNIILNILLIPTWGMMGAAFATTTSFILRTIFFAVLIERFVETEYNYLKITGAYFVFIFVLIFGHYVIPFIWLKELLAFLFLLFTYFFVLKKEEQAFVSRNIKESLAFLKLS